MDLSDVLLTIAMVAVLVAAFLVAAALGFLVLALEAGLLSVAAGGIKVNELDWSKVRGLWRS